MSCIEERFRLLSPMVLGPLRQTRYSWLAQRGGTSLRLSSNARDLIALDKTVMVLRYDPKRRFGNYRRIQIWWGLRGNGGMMLLLGYLLRAHYKWRNAQAEVMTVVQKESRIPEVKMALQLVLDNARLDAEPKVLVQGDESIPALMERRARTQTWWYLE